VLLYVLQASPFPEPKSEPTLTYDNNNIAPLARRAPLSTLETESSNQYNH
jgi:hypothetical protein